MTRFRAILLCLLMLAVPFQGYAAAAMVFCSSDSPADTHAMDRADSTPHDHAAHAHAASGAGLDIDLDDSSHKCSSCGNCAPCHAVALMRVQPAIAGHGLPQADLAEPRDVMATVTPGVLDRPPRA